MNNDKIKNLNFLPHSTPEERNELILKDLSKQILNVDPDTLGRHSGIEILFRCVVCNQPIKLSKKRVLDGKGLTHPGECRITFRRAGGKKARVNEDPIHKERRAQKLRDKMARDKDAIITKRKKSLIEKHGTDKLSQIEEIRENISNGVKKVYRERKQQIIKQRQETNLEKYGSTNFLTSNEGTKVVQEMSLRYFGTEYPFQNKEHRLKIVEDNTRKLQDGTSCYVYVKNHPNSKHIFRTTAYKILDEQGEEAFKEFCNKEPAKTILELNTEKLLEAEYYNHFPNKNVRFKPDFILKNQQDFVFINSDGLYWHSELEKENNYHFKMRENFEKENLRLLQFREDEIRDKAQIVKSIVNASLDIFSLKLDARKCKIKIVDKEETKLFLENNHLMGNYGRAKAYGLYYEEELVMIVSVRKSSQEEGYIEIARLCSKLNTTIRGGFQKLLHKIVKDYNPLGIISFCDLRYANGRSYLRNGFALESVSQGWQWTDFKNTFNRLRCRANMDSRKLSEKEHAKELGWVKIYDAGQAKFVKKIV